MISNHSIRAQRIEIAAAGIGLSRSLLTERRCSRPARSHHSPINRTTLTRTDAQPNPEGRVVQSWLRWRHAGCQHQCPRRTDLTAAAENAFFLPGALSTTITPHRPTPPPTAKPRIARKGTSKPAPTSHGRERGRKPIIAFERPIIITVSTSMRFARRSP